MPKEKKSCREILYEKEKMSASDIAIVTVSSAAAGTVPGLLSGSLVGVITGATIGCGVGLGFIALLVCCHQMNCANESEDPLSPAQASYATPSRNHFFEEKKAAVISTPAPKKTDTVEVLLNVSPANFDESPMTAYTRLV